MSTPAIFLDRDGTLNIEKEYLHRIEDWEWIPGAVEAIRLINGMGYLAIVVTNQAGVARGYYTDADVLSLHSKVDNMLRLAGAKIDAYYYCPHHPEHGDHRSCHCRKPEPGMLLAAQRDWNLDLKKSYMIGDKAIDVEAGLRARVSPILVLTGYGKEEQKKVDLKAVNLQADVLSAVHHIQHQLARRSDKSDVVHPHP